MLERLRQPLKERGQKGYVLLLLLVTTMALFISLSGILSLSLANLSGAKRTMFDTGALNAAEAGVDLAMYQLNATNGTYTGTTTCPVSGTSGATNVFNDTVKGKGTFQICVTAGSIAHEFIIYAVGKVYKTAGATNPVATRKLKVVATGNASTSSYVIATGPGGLIMSNSASVLGSNIAIGGYITMSNTAKIGSTTQPVSSLTVANQRCPAAGGATYPQICATGVNPNPITINNTAHIYGSVTANNQTNSYASAITNTGLVATSGATAPSLPSYNRPAQVTAVANNLTGAAASCSGSSTVTWPANVKITGNVTLSNSCHVIVSGNAWITGNLSPSNSADIKPAAGVSTMPVIMIDGSSGLTTSNTAAIGTNASSIGIEFITFYSTNSCTTATTVAAYCDVLTGTDLLNTQTHTTISISNQGSAPGAVLYSKYSEVDLNNGGAIGAVQGQTLNLSNSSTITVTGTTVSSTTYSYAVQYYEFQ